MLLFKPLGKMVPATGAKALKLFVAWHANKYESSEKFDPRGRPKQQTKWILSYWLDSESRKK